MPNKTLIDMFIGYCMKLFHVDVKKDFSQLNRVHLGLNRLCYLKTINQRWKYTWHY